MDDFANAIAYEVKQEIANRYFGFRTRIETQSKEYLAKLLETGREFDQGLRLDLCRMQFLLKEPRLFCDFLKLSGLPRDYALHLTSRQSAPTIPELFTKMRGEGFTRWRRFRGLAILVYRSLAGTVADYHEAFLLLEEIREEIRTEIEKFQRNNDLSDILSFLRNFDSLDSERLKFLHSNTTLRSGDTLATDLRLVVPVPVTETMILLNLLPPLNQVKGPFTELLKQAFTSHDNSLRSILPF